jgi:hypothetical protein
MALAPLLTEVGNEVWLLAGATKPILLRIGDMEWDIYPLVMDCYVHGIMDGKLWDNGTTARILTIYWFCSYIRPESLDPFWRDSETEEVIDILSPA